MKPVRFTAPAEADWNHARDWYENERPGLGAMFADAVEVVLEAVSEVPRRFPKVRGPMRRSMVPRFPYAIYFFEEARSIRVVAIMHLRRDPWVWRRRK